ncbi:MAG: PAS domain S-box protein [Alphaproteobacteria bacterium]|nr:PAS domain S-box protein [Alphaproteobacteria bacterium]
MRVPFERKGGTATWVGLLSAVLVFALSWATFSFLLGMEREKTEQRLRTEVLRRAAGAVSSLQSELNADIYLANGLAAYIAAQREITAEGAERALAALFAHGKRLRNVGMAPGNRLTHIHPREGNEGVIGLYYPDNPAQWPAVARAIDKGATVLAGPVDLIQGGRGLISRTPIFLNGAYWGVVSLVIDLDRLLADAGLAPEVDGVRFALRGKDGLGKDGAVFFGDPGLFDDGAPVLLEIDIPDGHWYLAALPAGGWAAAQRGMATLDVGAAGLALILALLSYFALAERARNRASSARLREVVRELSDREASLREFSEAHSDWFWESDSNHRFAWFSPSFELVLGIEPALMIGKRRWDVASAEDEIDASLWEAHMDDLKAHRKFRDFRYWIRSPDKSRWVSISGMPRFDAQGCFLGYRGAGTDVTREAEMAIRLRLLAQVVEKCPVSVVVTDPCGTLEYVNPRFLQVTGYSRDEVLGQNPRILASGETPREVYAEMWDTVNAGRSWAGEFKNKKKSGEHYWESALVAPILDDHDRVVHLIGIKEDVTAKRQAERSLAEAHVLLESQAAELSRSNQELEQFAYVASHDLRQPLRMISSYLTLLERHMKGALDDEAKTFMGYVRGGAAKMDALILSLLEYSRIGRGDRPFAPVALAEVVSDSLLMLDSAVAEAGAEVKVADGLPEVSGDRVELVRLFQNLIGNAVKYRAPGRAPVVTVDWTENGAEWLLSVADNGIGIPPAAFDRVFVIFQRLVSGDRYEGTGIGLAVCRKIAEHHGGRIWVESTEGQGSRFTVALPKSAAGVGH